MNTKIKKWFFKTCPKSGRIVGINKKNVVLKICFPLFGLAALIWFLIRVVPKPSRIEYPCQQIAAPIAFSFVAFISSTLVGFGTWKHFKLLAFPSVLYGCVRIGGRYIIIGYIIYNVSG